MHRRVSTEKHYSNILSTISHNENWSFETKLVNSSCEKQGRRKNKKSRGVNSNSRSFDGADYASNSTKIWGGKCPLAPLDPTPLIEASPSSLASMTVFLIIKQATSKSTVHEIFLMVCIDNKKGFNWKLRAEFF